MALFCNLQYPLPQSPFHSSLEIQNKSKINTNTTYSLNSHRIRSNCSSLNLLTSATLRLNTCFPIQLFPTNFFDIRMGSQFNNLDRNARSVVPSVNGSNPDLNSFISRVAYASSSVVHFPRRSGCCLAVVFFLVGEDEDDVSPTAELAVSAEPMT